MPYDISNKLKIAVTTRALFRLEEEDKLYKEQGTKVYEAYQIKKLMRKWFMIVEIC